MPKSYQSVKEVAAQLHAEALACGDQRGADALEYLFEEHARRDLESASREGSDFRLPPPGGRLDGRAG